MQQAPPPSSQLPRLGLGAPLAAAALALAVVGASLLWAARGATVDRGITLLGNVKEFAAPGAVTHGIGGTIAHIAAREGDVVAAGDVLVTLDRTELDGQIAALATRVAEARHQITAARAEARALIDRIDEGGDTADAHIGDLERYAKALQRDVAALEGRIALAEMQLAQTEVRAPHAGRVVTLAAVAPGDVLAPGAVLAEIAPVNAPVVVEARVSAALAGRLQPGMPVKAWLAGPLRRELAPSEARIVAIEPAAEADGRFGIAFHRVTIDLDPPRRDQPRKRPAPGHRVELLVPTGERSLLAHVLDPARRNIDPALRQWLKELLAS